MDEHLSNIILALKEAESDDPQHRDRVKATLHGWIEGSEGFGVTLLWLVNLEETEPNVCMLAAKSFEKFIEVRWSSLCAEEKSRVRTKLVECTVTAASGVRACLSNALHLMAVTDFPSLWPELVPRLVKLLTQSRDFHTIRGILIIMNKLLKKYRRASTENVLLDEVASVSQMVMPSLVLLIREIEESLVANSRNDVLICELFACSRLIFKIWFSLSGYCALKEAEGSTTFLISVLNRFLEWKPLDWSLHAVQRFNLSKGAACDVLSLYIKMNKEEIKPYLSTQLEHVYELFMRTMEDSEETVLRISGTRFLDALVRSEHCGLLTIDQEETIKRLCDLVIIPNLRVQRIDESLLAFDYREYYHRDVKATFSTFLKQVTGELVKSLMWALPCVTRYALMDRLERLLMMRTADSNDFWKSKHLAVNLMLVGGVGIIKPDSAATIFTLLDFKDGPENNMSQMFRIDALKVLWTFHQYISREVLSKVLPVVVRMVGDRRNAVHTYAAACLTRVLCCELIQAITHLLPALTANLFGVFTIKGSGQNEWALDAVMHIIRCMEADFGPLVAPCLNCLSDLLARNSMEADDLKFTGKLLDCVSMLCPWPCGSSGEIILPQLVHLVSCETPVLAAQATSILTHMIEAHTDGGLSESYSVLIPHLLIPSSWEHLENAAPLCYLLKIFLHKAPQEMVNEKNLEGILGVFQKLMTVNARVPQSFLILETLVSYLRLATLETYLPAIWGVLFTKYSSRQCTAFNSKLLLFTCSLVAKYGVRLVEDSITQVQEGIFESFISTLVAGGIATAMNSNAPLAVIDAVMKFLIECPNIASKEAEWAKIFAAVVECFNLPGAGARVVNVLATHSMANPQSLSVIITRACSPRVQEVVAAQCRDIGAIIN